MNKRPFKKLSSFDLHKMIADSYGTNLRDKAQAMAELNHRQALRQWLAIAISSVVLFLTLFATFIKPLFNNTPVKALPPLSNSQYSYPETKIDKQENKNANVDNLIHKIPPKALK